MMTGRTTADSACRINGDTKRRMLIRTGLMGVLESAVHGSLQLSVKVQLTGINKSRGNTGENKAEEESVSNVVTIWRP